MQFSTFLHVFKEITELWDVAHLLCLQHFCPLLSGEVLYSVYAQSQHCPLAAFLWELTGENTSAKEQQNPVACASSSERSSLLTLLVCVLTLPCSCVCWHLGICCWVREQSCCRWSMSSPTVMDRGPCAGNTVSEPDGYFHNSPYPMSFQQ